MPCVFGHTIAGGFNKLVAKLLHHTEHGHRCTVGECANRIAHHVVGDVDDKFDVGFGGLACAKVVQHIDQPTRALATRCALTA